MRSGSVLDYTAAATGAQLDALAARLRERNFEALIADDAAAAKDAVLARIPDGAEVHSGKSKTLEDIGVTEALHQPGRYDFLRSRLVAMDRQTQAREMRKLAAAPDYMVGSVQAVTSSGQLVVASASGSQIGPYASGAGQLILVVGSQKLVPDLDAALQRITEHVQPYEDQRLREQMGVGTALCRVLVLERDYRPGRTAIILVRQPLGY
jgi:hypothetical protein